MQTIHELFLHLVNTSSRFSKEIRLVDSLVRIHSSSMAYVEELEKTFQCTTLNKEIVAASCDNSCVVENSENCPQWQDLLPADPIRIQEDPYVGDCRIYKVSDGFILIQTQGWIVCRSTNGQIIFLLNGSLETEDKNRWPNTTGLACILFSEVLAYSNKWLVHAAGIGYNGYCHLFTGQSGAGKTTRALAHTEGGRSFFGDDMVVIGKGNNDQWYVWPYWRPLHITGHTHELLPTLKSCDGPLNSRDKTTVDITHLFDITPPPVTPLKSIWFLTPDEETRPHALDHRKAFALLSRTFMHGFWPETTQSNLEALLDIVFQVPVFILSRSTPLPQMIDELYEEIS
jgi:hypothetical protein